MERKDYDEFSELSNQIKDDNRDAKEKVNLREQIGSRLNDLFLGLDDKFSLDQQKTIAAIFVVLMVVFIIFSILN